MSRAFGPHVNREPGAAAPLLAGLHSARRAAEVSGVSLGAWAAFMSGPRGGPVALRPGEAENIRAKILSGAAPPLFAHAAYTTRLGPSASSGASSGASLGDQLAAVAACGGTGLIVHLMKDTPAAAAGKLADALSANGITDEPADGPHPIIYLEIPAFVPARAGARVGTSAGATAGATAGRAVPVWESPEIGVATFADPAGLAELWRELAAHAAPMTRLGLCVDTAHAWTGGVCLRWREPAAAWLAAIDRDVIPLIATAPPAPRILLHLNDSEKNRGSGPDSHAPLGRGRIWAGWDAAAPASEAASAAVAAAVAVRPPDGLDTVVGWAARNGYPAILERDDPAALAGDYAIIKKITTR